MIDINLALTIAVGMIIARETTRIISAILIVVIKKQCPKFYDDLKKIANK